MSKFLYHFLAIFIFLMTPDLFAEDILLLTINLEKDLFISLTKDLEDIFKRKVKIETYNLDILFSYHQKRRQFCSSLILDRLSKKYSSKEDIVLAIIDEDLYAEGLNFVFGQADPENKIAIISITRLRQEFYGLPKDEILFHQRTLKEAVHEIGHIFGLSHCPNPKCVMHFSNSLLDTDIKDFRFCSICKKKIK